MTGHMGNVHPLEVLLKDLAGMGWCIHGMTDAAKAASVGFLGGCIVARLKSCLVTELASEGDAGPWLKPRPDHERCIQWPEGHCSLRFCAKGAGAACNA